MLEETEKAIELLAKEGSTKKTSRKTKERKLSFDIADHLHYNYTDAVFRFDVGADVKLTIGQASIINNKLRHRRGYHDLTILEPRGGYFGLFIELKKGISEVYTKKGLLAKRKNNRTGTDHNVEQRDHLLNMISKGYYATYGFGKEATIKIIDQYMALPPTVCLMDKNILL